LIIPFYVGEMMKKNRSNREDKIIIDLEMAMLLQKENSQI